MVESMARNADWLLFVAVLANQAGIPLPVTPWLLAAGVLAASGQLSLIVVVAGAVAAALAADLAWYGLGRWRGTAALTGLLRVLRRPPATFDRVTRVFRAHRAGFVWSARFLPELNPIAAGLAGVTGVGLSRFLLYASGSALGWAGAWAGGGFLLAWTIGVSADRLGMPTIVWVTVALTTLMAAVIVLAGWRRGRPSQDGSLARRAAARAAARRNDLAERAIAA